MDIVKYYGCYDYNKEWYLVEMLLDIPPSEIDWSNINVPQKGLKRSSWQCAYMEQYLNENGTEKICETYDEPKENVKPCRVVFFIFKVPANILSTPYGDFELKSTNKVPERLENIVEFEEVD